MDDIQKAKEEALEKYLSRCDHEPDSPNYKGWPMSVCDVCRGRFSEESFEAGFDAGLSHAHQWVEIKSENDLPRPAKSYLWHEKAGATRLRYYSPDEAKDYLVKRYDAWMPIPPFTPKGEQQ